MKYKVISCEVLKNELTYLINKHNLDLDISYTKKSAHVKPEQLHEEIQNLIDESQNYEYILLGFGLCGNALKGLKSNNSQLVVPRAHDCCTLFLGSTNRFNELFSENLSIPWGSCGYSRIGEEYLRDDVSLGVMQEKEELIKIYGEENAEYIYKTLHPDHDNNDVYFIKINETHDDVVYKQFITSMKDNNKKVTVKQGSLTLLEKLLTGQWDEQFLLINRQATIGAIYDKEQIMYCKIL